VAPLAFATKITEPSPVRRRPRRTNYRSALVRWGQILSPSTRRRTSEALHVDGGANYRLFMAEGRGNDAAIVAKWAAAVIARVGERLGELASSVQQMLATEIGELGEDVQLMELLHDSVEGNIDTVFSAIRHGIPIERVEPPTAALEQARRLAQRGVSVNALVRAYRLGHMAVLNEVRDQVRASGLESQLSLDVFGRISEITFGYIDWITQQVLSAYQRERDRWMENRNSMRALRVRDVLSGDEIDVDAMSAAIRYPLRRIHLSIVVWCNETADGDELALMERFVRQLAQSIGARESSLFIPVDRLTGSAWIPLPPSDAPGVVARIRAFAEEQPDAPWIGVGNPLPGVKGFRRSHAQAQGACAVAIASGSNARRVTAASDSGLSVAALLGDNVDAASAWVGEVLGPLASPEASDERLRETLRVFLGAGSSFKAAGEELHLHVNSVKYRVRRAIERRGRPITDDRLDVEVALLLCHWFGEAVLG
jgi:DNA-binding PucR family transcriptional regulator